MASNESSARRYSTVSKLLSPRCHSLCRALCLALEISGTYTGKKKWCGNLTLTWYGTVPTYYNTKYAGSDQPPLPAIEKNNYEEVIPFTAHRTVRKLT